MARLARRRRLPRSLRKAVVDPGQTMTRVSKTSIPSRDRKGLVVKPTARHQASDAEKKALERLRALAAGLRDAAKHPAKAESIHDLRVAIRRFTQVLSV